MAKIPEVKTISVRKIPRAMGLSPFVFGIGIVKGKTFPVDATYKHFHFGVVTRGKGRVEIDGDSFEVRAPFLILQMLGRRIRLVPDPDWDEYYMSLADDRVKLYAPYCLDKKDMIKPIADLEFMSSLWSQAFCCAEALNRPGMADKIDCLAANILAEALFPNTPVPRDERIASIEKYIRENLHGDPDMKKLAGQNAMSHSAFKRRWMAEIGVSPMKYIHNLRIQKAYSLLAEGSMSVKEISYEVGYRNADTFSRKFRDFFGIPPSAIQKKQPVLPGQ